MITSSVADLQRCAMCCSSCGSLPGCSGFEALAFPGGRLQKLTSRKLRHGKTRKKLTTSLSVVTRSLYSPLVESFSSTEERNSAFSYDLNSLSELDKYSAPSERHDPSGADLAYQRFLEDSADIEKIQLAPRDPYGDYAPHEENLSDKFGQDVDVKRSARARPPTMSLSHRVISSSGRRAVSHTVAAVGSHPMNATKLPGPMGFAMAFTVAALGLKTAVEKQAFLPQKACEKCSGYGVQQCHVCQGRGVLVWEGKLRHTDPCPLCFGSCLKKCSSCGGVKMRKGVPPALVTKFKVKAGSSTR